MNLNTIICDQIKITVLADIILSYLGDFEFIIGININQFINNLNKLDDNNRELFYKLIIADKQNYKLERRTNKLIEFLIEKSKKWKADDLLILSNNIEITEIEYNRADYIISANISVKLGHYIICKSYNGDNEGSGDTYVSIYKNNSFIFEIKTGHEFYNYNFEEYYDKLDIMSNELNLKVNQDIFMKYLKSLINFLDLYQDAN